MTARTTASMRPYLWSLLDTVVSRGFSAVLVLVLGNLLLPGDLGLYVAVMMVASYAMATLSFGVDKAIVQKLNDAELGHRRDEYFTAGAICAGAMAMGAPLLLEVLRDPLLGLFDLEAAPALYTLALPLVFLQIHRKYYSSCLQADLEYRRLVIIGSLAAATKLVGALTLLRLGYGLPGLLVGLYAGEMVDVLLLALRSYRKHDVALGPRTVRAARDTLGFGLVIHLSAVAVFLDKNVDLLLVNYFLGKADLAVYNYAMQGALVLLLLGNGISGVTYPRLTAAFSAGDTEEVQRLYSGAIRIVFTVLSLGTIGALIHLDALVTLVLPEYYLRTTGPFTLLVSAMVLFGAVASVGTVLTARGQPHYGAFLNWGAVLINAVLCLALIPAHGVIGAAWATAGTFTLRSIVSLLLADWLFETGLSGLTFGAMVAVFGGCVAAVHFLGPPAVAGWAVWLVYAGLLASVLWSRQELESFLSRIRGSIAGEG